MKTKLINCESDPNSWLETGVQRGFTGRWLRCFAATATVAATATLVSALACLLGAWSRANGNGYGNNCGSDKAHDEAHAR